jgi:hypothetical protein
MGKTVGSILGIGVVDHGIPARGSRGILGSDSFAAGCTDSACGRTVLRSGLDS